MKSKLLVLSLLLTVVFQADAQNVERSNGENDAKTLLGSGGSLGGFLGFGNKLGKIKGDAAFLVGGELAAVFSHGFNIGLVGYGLTTNVDAGLKDSQGRELQLHMGYGGLLFEPVIKNKEIFHLTTPMIIGVGGGGLHREPIYNLKEDINEPDTDKFYNDNGDAFLVLEPGLSLEINLVKFVRLDLGATYRFVIDSDIENFSDEDLSGFTGSLTLKLGWF